MSTDENSETIIPAKLFGEPPAKVIFSSSTLAILFELSTTILYSQIWV